MSEIFTPIKTLNGHSLVDTVAREQISQLSMNLEEYLLDIDYELLLAFDTTEIITTSNTTSVLGQAILGRMILA